MAIQCFWEKLALIRESSLFGVAIIFDDFQWAEFT
jgi:hypothetical protein